jgi:hypothetical protein
MVILKNQQEIDPDDPKVQDLKWAQDKLHRFYQRSFNLPPGHLDLEQIKTNINKDQGSRNLLSLPHVVQMFRSLLI